MATIQDLTAQVQQARQDVHDASDRSKAFADSMLAKIEDLRAQLAAAGEVPADVVAALDEIEATAKGIDPTIPDVIPTPEPPPTPTP